MDVRAQQSETLDVRSPAADRPGNMLRRAMSSAGSMNTAAGRKQLRAPLMFGGIAIVAVVALAMWLIGGRYISTDDAYVHAAKLMVSAEVSGKVAEVDVKEGDLVKKGQVLFKLDAQPFEIALANAKARLAQTMLDIDAMKTDYRRMLGSIDAQKPQVSLAKTNFDRAARLLGTHYVSRAAYDQARFALASAQGTYETLQQMAQTQLAKLAGNADIADADHPQVRQAQAAVDEAQRQVNASVVRAPFEGVITQVSALQPGTYIVSSMASFVATSAVGLVSTSNLWVDANLKETQLTYIKPGNPATVKIDTFPGHTWKATVCAVSPTTGSEFSLLPAINSSGNWVKVVQRISVKICVVQQAGDPPLSAGMSAKVKIDTGHTRSLSNLF